MARASRRECDICGKARASRRGRTLAPGRGNMRVRPLSRLAGLTGTRQPRIKTAPNPAGSCVSDSTPAARCPIRAPSLRFPLISMSVPPRYLVTEELPKPVFKNPWILALVEAHLSRDQEHLRQAHARVQAATKAFQDAQQRIVASIVLIERARTVCSGRDNPHHAAGAPRLEPAPRRSGTDSQSEFDRGPSR